MQRHEAGHRHHECVCEQRLCRHHQCLCRGCVDTISDIISVYAVFVTPSVCPRRHRRCCHLLRDRLMEREADAASERSWS